MMVAIVWWAFATAGAATGTVLLVLGTFLLVSVVLHPPQEDLAEVVTAVRVTHPDSSTSRVIEHVEGRRPDIRFGRIYHLLVGLERIGVVERFHREGESHVRTDARGREITVPVSFWKVSGPLPPRRARDAVRMATARLSAR